MERAQTLRKYKSKLGNPEGRLKFTIGEAFKTQTPEPKNFHNDNAEVEKKVSHNKNSRFTQWAKQNPLKAALFIPYTVGIYTPRKIFGYISKKIKVA